VITGYRKRTNPGQELLCGAIPKKLRAKFISGLIFRIAFPLLVDTPGDGSVPAVQRHSTENSCFNHQSHRYDGLPGSVETILTLFFFFL